VEERLGPAAETLDALLADPAQHGSYDFAFIDADKKVRMMTLALWLEACGL
jgi:predicted O-methyltransferase YrrM